MNIQAQVGHNNPPDPIDEWLAPYSDTLEEAQNWLDGEPIETEDQMKAVDALIKTLRTANTDLGKAKKSASAPLHDAWKAELARWKPTEDDLDRIRKGLVALVEPIKKRLADEKAAAERAAREEAARLEREAREKLRQAEASNIEAQREAAAAAQKAEDARKAAQAAAKDDVKGMRTVHKHEITDMRALVNWIATNDKPAMAEFATEYARRHFQASNMAGVRVWSKKEAF